MFASLDWRAWAVIAAGAITVIATGVVYYLGIGLDPATHFGAVFAGWVAGVALFIIAGAVVALVSLARPEREPFDARARILFRRQTGKHVDYIVERIREVLEHYAERTTIKVTIRGYDATENKFRVAAYNKVLVRSYLDDVETTYISALSRREVAAPPPGGEPNKLVFARVAGDPVGVAEVFDEMIERPVSCRLERNGVCEVESLMEFWVKGDDEPNSHKPRRYTQVLTLEFENLLGPEHPVAVKLTENGQDWITEQLPSGRTRQVLEVKDKKPGESVFDYRLTRT